MRSVRIGCLSYCRRPNRAFGPRSTTASRTPETDLLEFTLCNYEDISFRDGVDAEQLELFEVCAALEERIVGILIAEEYEQ